jgi:hypothetical protein
VSKSAKSTAARNPSGRSAVSSVSMPPKLQPATEIAARSTYGCAQPIDGAYDVVVLRDERVDHRLLLRALGQLVYARIPRRSFRFSRAAVVVDESGKRPLAVGTP